MSRKELSKLRPLLRVDPEMGQTFVRRALEATESLPETTINDPVKEALQQGVDKGFLEQIRPGVYKLVGKRGGERP